MFFSHLSLGGFVLALAVAFIVKYFGVGLVQKTAFYQSRVAGQGWMGALNTVAGLNGLLTAAILLIPAGLFWAVTFGAIDIAIHWLVGYWQIKKKLPTIDAGNWETARGWVMAIHGTSYAGIIAWVVKYLWSPGS